MTDAELIQYALVHYARLRQRALHVYRVQTMQVKVVERTDLYSRRLRAYPATGHELKVETVGAFMELNESLYEVLQPGVNPDALLKWAVLYPSIVLEVLVKRPQIAENPENPPEIAKMA